MFKKILEWFKGLVIHPHKDEPQVIIIEDKTDDPMEPEEVYEEDTIEPVKPVDIIIPEVVVPIVIPIITPTKKFTLMQHLLPSTQYVDKDADKNQIVLHHTAGGSAMSTINYWNSNTERVSVHFIVDRDGTIYQCIPLSKWAYHLYVTSPGNKIDKKFKAINEEYDKHSIGIEIANYGFVIPTNGKFKNIYKGVVDTSKVTKLNFMGYQYWEAYTQEQIDSVEWLIKEVIIKQYPVIKTGLKEDYSKISEISLDALNRKPGVYSHRNYRTDKFDLYPYQPMINMLNTLCQM